MAYHFPCLLAVLFVIGVSSSSGCNQEDFMACMGSEPQTQGASMEQMCQMMNEKLKCLQDKIKDCKGQAAEAIGQSMLQTMAGGNKHCEGMTGSGSSGGHGGHGSHGGASENTDPEICTQAKIQECFKDSVAAGGKDMKENCKNLPSQLDCLKKFDVCKNAMVTMALNSIKTEGHKLEKKCEDKGYTIGTEEKDENTAEGKKGGTGDGAMNQASMFILTLGLFVAAQLRF